MDLKKYLVGANYVGTWPLRQWRNRQRESSGTAPIMVLFYHRVADTHLNDWTIPRQLFRRQILWLKRHVELISLHEAQQRIKAGANHKLAACVTFDDGYAENCDFALPFLVEEAVPCTYFVATRHMTHGDPFPHDVAAGQPLNPNTPDQIASLAKAGIEIGAHTRSHIDIGSLKRDAEIYSEIVESGEELAEVTGQPIRYFAFPYGQMKNMSVEAFQIAQDAGFAGVCSAYGGYNLPGQDAFQIRRIHADPEMIRFLNWMSVDERKFAMHPAFPYDSRTRVADTFEAGPV